MAPEDAGPPPAPPAPHAPAAGPGGWVAPRSGWGPSTTPQPKAGSARSGPLPLHPMTLGDVIDGAFKLLKANAATVVLIAAMFLVPIQLAGAWLQRDLFGGRGLMEVLDDPSTARVAAESGDDGAALATVLGLASALLVLPFVAGAIAKVVAASYVGEDLEAGPALSATVRRWWPLVSAWVLVHLAEWGGGILAALILLAGVATGGVSGVSGAAAVVVGLAGIPLALVMTALFVAVAPAIVVEGLGPVQGMRRSARLLRPRMFPVLGIAIVAGLLSSVIGSALGFLPQLAALAIGTGNGGWLLLALGAIVPGLVTTPFIAIVSTLVYFDGRIRQEGFDLHVLAARLAADATA